LEYRNKTSVDGHEIASRTPLYGLPATTDPALKLGQLIETVPRL